MTKSIQISSIVVVCFLLVGFLIAVIVSGLANPVFGSAPTGLIARVATSSTQAVGTTSVSTLFTENTVCASRVVTTASQPIMLSFSADITPTATVGHIQAASTTVSYDSGIYGCSQVTAYGYAFGVAAASTTITKTELR